MRSRSYSVNLSASPWQQPDGAGANAAANDVSVTGFSDSGAHQTTITNVLQRLVAALPLYPDCNNWLQGTGAYQGISGVQQIQALLAGNNFGHGTVQVGTTNAYNISAFSGSRNPDGTAVNGIQAFLQFTVNDVGAFFNQNDNQHNAFHTKAPNGPDYRGNNEHAREFILVHETAHQISVNLFTDDFTDQRAEDANNQAVNDHCRGLIEGPRIDRLRPNTGPVGTVVTITGHNFGTPPQGTTVAGTVVFNGNAQATPTSWSDTQIIVTVPVGATTGDVVINVANKTDNQRFTIQ